jgi:hypothetical protein
MFFAAMLSGPQIGASSDDASSGNPWRCNGHLLPDFNMSSADAGGSQEGISYLYIGAHGLKNDYLAAIRNSRRWLGFPQRIFRHPALSASLVGNVERPFAIHAGTLWV